MITDSILTIHSHEYVWDSVRNSLRRWTSGGDHREVTRRDDALAAIDAQPPKVILASDTLDGDTSYPMLAHMRERLGPRLLISVFASEIDPVSMHRFAQLNLSGFFQSKDLRNSEAVATALRIALTPELMGATPAIVRDYFQMARSLAGAPTPAEISSRQQQILRLLIAGSTYDSIARSLGCSRRTVDRELDSMMGKLESDNVHDLIMRATIYGLLP